MRVILQRTLTEAKVTVDDQITGKIDKGLVILLGVENEDTLADIEWLSKKIINMRIFSDADGKMNLSVQDIKGSLLVISQFTLHASTKKGNRPSFINAAKPDYANEMYRTFIDYIREEYKILVEEGKFGGDMKVNLINDGPVTIFLDSKRKE